MRKLILGGLVAATIIAASIAIFIGCQKETRSTAEVQITDNATRKIVLVWGWLDGNTFYANYGGQVWPDGATLVFEGSRYIYPYPDNIRSICSRCGATLPSPYSSCTNPYCSTRNTIKFPFNDEEDNGVEGWMELHRRVFDLMYRSPSERQELVASYEDEPTEYDALRLSSRIPIALINKVISGIYQIAAVTETISATGLEFEYNIQFANATGVIVNEQTVSFRYILNTDPILVDPILVE
jgi:hypothetical protein